MPDTEVGQILTEFYGQGRQTMTLNSQPQVQVQGQPSSRPEGDYHSQFRSQYQSHPSPTPVSTPGNSHLHQTHTPNSYSAPHNPSPHPPHTPNYAPSHDGLPRPGPFHEGANVGDPTVQQKRTRTRPTKSCERCRGKKLKCDREFPCGNCKKGGRDGRNCFYRDGWEGDERVEEERAFKRVRVGDPGPSTGAVPNGGDLGVVQRMVRIGEAMGDGAGAGAVVVEAREPEGFSRAQPFWAGSIATTAGRVHGESSIPIPPSWTSSNAVKSTSATPGISSNTTSYTLGRIDVKGKRSRYIAPGDKMGIMDHFEDSKKFITNGFKDPDMVGIMQELSAFQKFLLPKRPRVDPRDNLPQDYDGLAAEMLRSLPSGFFFGILQAKYISNWETVQRVLHIRTFMKECDEVAAVRDSGAVDLPSHIKEWVLPQILSALAIASRLDDPTDRGSTSERISDAQIARNIELIKRWLELLPGKANICFHTLQTRTLLLLTQQANLFSVQDLWKDSGTLVRHAMGMGLHQDPEDCSHMSPFDKEMRRKLWTTIVELDMQFSLAAGMPAAIMSSNFTLKQLVNADDQEFTEQMPSYPENKTDSIWTNALPQIALSTSIKDRLDITNWLGGHLNLEQDMPALVSRAEILEKALRALPHQFRASTRAGNANNKRIYRLFASIMLDMSIRRPLLALYRTVTLSPHAKQYPEARRGALRCSLAMLSHLDALDPAIADLSIVKSRDYLNLFHILYKNDITQAALLVCNEIRAFNTIPISATSSTTTFTCHDDDEPENSFPQTKHSLTRVVENTLNSLISRLGEFGSDLKEILTVSVVLQSVRAEGTNDKMREVMKRGAERVLVACRRAMPGVQEQFLHGTNEKRTPAHSSSSDNWNSVVLQNQNGNILSLTDMNMTSVDDFDFQNFDFGWSDWGMNQSWL